MGNHGNIDANRACVSSWRSIHFFGPWILISARLSSWLRRPWKLPGCIGFLTQHGTTWWFIPLSKWVITPVISGLTLLIPFITGVITHLLSGMSHQAVNLPGRCTLCVSASTRSQRCLRSMKIQKKQGVQRERWLSQTDHSRLWIHHKNCG